MSMSVKADTATTCTCEDKDLDTLRDLVTAGFNQLDVCRLLWGDGTPVSDALAREWARRQTRSFVRKSFAKSFPWLRLPSEQGGC